jgi:precorrin-2 dehydrogenase/sirohydrochlorin ferrochelatase
MLATCLPNPEGNIVAYYPICLNITNKRCVIVGGGEVGARKAEGLVACGARVVVLGRKLAFPLEKMKQEGRIDHIEVDYAASYLRGAFLVIGATDSAEVNEKIAADARAQGILVNIADDPLRCDFILPAVVRRGDLVISVSTGGKSPALAGKLKVELDAFFGQEYATLLDILGSVREKQLDRGCPAEENKRIFTALVNSAILDHIRAGSREGVQACLRNAGAPGLELTEFDLAGKG